MGGSVVQLGTLRHQLDDHICSDRLRHGCNILVECWFRIGELPTEGSDLRDHVTHNEARVVVRLVEKVVVI